MLNIGDCFLLLIFLHLLTSFFLITHQGLIDFLLVSTEDGLKQHLLQMGISQKPDVRYLFYFLSQS